MKIKELTNLDLLFLFDKSIVNNPHSEEKKNNFVFEHLFEELDFQVKKYFDKLMTLFDIHYGNLTIDDFFTINKCIKQNDIFAESFFTALTIEIINIYHNILDQKLYVAKYSTGDFVLRAIFYTIFKTINNNLHGHSPQIDFKTHVIDLFNTIFEKFNKIMIVQKNIKKIKKYFNGGWFEYIFKNKKNISDIQNILHQHSLIVSSFINSYKLKKDKKHKVYG